MHSTTTIKEFAPRARCTREDGIPNSILHTKGEDCDKVHGLRIESYVCSVCDAPNDGTTHRQCDTVYPDGSRDVAEWVAVLSDGSRLIKV